MTTNVQMVTREFGTRLCAAMGLDAGRVRTVDVHFAADEAVTAKVGVFVDGEVAERLLTLLEDGSWKDRD